MDNLKAQWRSFHPATRAAVIFVVVVALACLVSEEARNGLLGLDP